MVVAIAPPDQRSFASRIQCAPRAFDPRRGEEAAALLGAESTEVSNLIAGAAGSSPYINGLIKREVEWLREALGQSPEAAFAALLSPYDGTAGARETGEVLRRMKRRAALLVALADLGGVWSLEEVTGALSDLADHAVDHAFAQAITGERTGPLAGKSPAEAGLIVLAMGKGGARELNYSSDIDLILFFDEERIDDDIFELKHRWTQVTRRVVKLLTEATSEGYVFRTDLRLRPNPSVTPICMPIGAAERYYESIGRTWERAAFIKARASGGDIDAGRAFLAHLTPFVWRRSLDYAALEDVNDIRAKIRDAKGLGGVRDLPGYNIKLGPGGIREIEFFAQTQQLVRGGRDKSLRARETVPALGALTAAGHLSEDDRDALTLAYRQHRRLEHLFQMIEDAQTHHMPISEEAREQVAALGGWPDRKAMEDEVAARLADVRARVTRFFDVVPAASEKPTLSISDLPFERPDMVREMRERWLDGGIAATRDERARRKIAGLIPTVLERLATAGAPDDAVIQFDRFLSGLPAGVQLFSLFEANPKLLALLVEICAAAPALAEYLSRNSSVLDAVLDRAFFEPLPALPELSGELTAELAGVDDYESVLDGVRRWAKDKRFQLGVQVLRGVADEAEAGQGFSDVAEACLRALLPHVEANFARRHGPPPGRGAAVIAMGKLGSCEMSAGSDLDLIVVYDAQGAEASDGPRPLMPGPYFARLTQMLVSALTAPTAEGSLYEVDMRLRPSGSKGPVAVNLESFRNYQMGEAWTWEHMALTRARLVGGGKDLCDELTGVIADVLISPRVAADVKRDVSDMRGKLVEAHKAVRDELWAIKHGAGGLMDIEFAAQNGLLAASIAGAHGAVAALSLLVERGALPAADAECLQKAYRLQARLQQVERVALSAPFRSDTAGAGLKRVMARVADAEDFSDLEQKLETARAAAAEIVDRLLGE
ncbi:MAG: bifunctional [glutamine synthetase] adenylyltransferase/[glutamine synthetase]-adenylyl-L-tyrosine phosphorylase [Pikeienuella sp.]